MSIWLPGKHTSLMKWHTQVLLRILRLAGILAIGLMLWGCTIPGPVPSEQDIETLLTSYPSMTSLIRNERFDVPYIITAYAFDVADSQEAVLAYYRPRLLQHGFLPTTARGGAIPSDIYYRRKGCPTYGVLIAIDAATGHVVIEFSRSQCM